MNKNAYFIRAKLFPTIITAIPMLVLVNLLFNGIFKTALENISSVLSMLAHLGLSTAIIFLSTLINRVISKELFQNFYFKNELNFPSTTHLLWNDSFIHADIKRKIREKIVTKYSLHLPNDIDEARDELSARQKIHAAVAMIKNSLRGEYFLFQTNIAYGFTRNLIGGCVIASLCAIGIIILGIINKDHSILITGCILLIYLFPIIFSKYLLQRFGHYYSKTLYEQFLSYKYE